MRLRSLAIAALCVLPGALSAQQYSPFVLAADATTLRVLRDVATSQLLEGPVLGGEAAVSFRRLQLEGRYVEGSLTPGGALTADEEKFVDARIVARYSILPGLALGVGPHLRAFVTPNGTARWSRMEIHTRAEGDLINGLARVRFDVWFAASATSNVQGGGKGAMGGEVGLVMRIPNTPTAVQLMYTADRATFANGGAEFVEGVRVGLVLDRILRARSGSR